MIDRILKELVFSFYKHTFRFLLLPIQVLISFRILLVSLSVLRTLGSVVELLASGSGCRTLCGMLYALLLLFYTYYPDA